MQNLAGALRNVAEMSWIIRRFGSYHSRPLWPDLRNDRLRTEPVSVLSTQTLLYHTY